MVNCRHKLHSKEALELPIRTWDELTEEEQMRWEEIGKLIEETK